MSHNRVTSSNTPDINSVKINSTVCYSTTNPLVLRLLLQDTVYYVVVKGRNEIFPGEITKTYFYQESSSL